MTAYAHLQPDDDDEALAKNKKMIEDTDAIFMNDTESRHKSGFTSYLDEFLSAIRIFGYLEKPVFHELTKSMRTQRLEEGEIMLLDDTLGFAIVVEGNLQIYHKVENNMHSSPPPLSTQAHQTDNDIDGDDDDTSSLTEGYTINGEKFQLLNNVKAGNPISSLVSILKLFTDNNPDSPLNQRSSSTVSDESNLVSPYLDSNVERHRENLDANSRKGSIADGVFQTLHANLNIDVDPSAIDLQLNDEPGDSNESSPVDDNGIPVVTPLPNIVARASSDCTVATIPSAAFRRLTVKYPRSASHIIQMILTKLYRVTFQTAHNYLGLTKEIMHTEIVLNNSVKFELPRYLKEGIIKKIDKERDSSPEPNSNDSKSTKKTSSRPSIKHTNLKESFRNSPQETDSLGIRSSRHVVLDSRDQFNPGDLLSNVPLSRKEFTPTTSNSSIVKAINDSKNNESSSKNTSSMHIYNTTSSSTNTASTANSIPSRPSASPLSIAEHPKFLSESGSGMDEDIRSRSFSAAREETEESSRRMALVEGMFAFLGITQENMIPSNESDISLPTRRASEVSLGSSMASSQAFSNPMFKFLPNEHFASKKLKYAKKRSNYTEDVPNNLDFETAKNEFAQGLEIDFIPAGTTIVEQNSSSKGLFYIVSGTLDVIWKNDQSDSEHLMYTVKPGGIAGYLAALIGYKSFVSLRAKTDLYVGFLPAEVVERLCDKYFMIYLRIAESLTSLLSPKILKLDYAMEWIHLEASETLFNQNDPANAIYVVLNGRLRQLHQSTNSERSARKKKKQKKDHLHHNANVQVLGEHAQGDSFGEVEVLTAINRLSTVVAVRDSELARIPRTLFEVLALEHPSIMIRVSRLVARKILQQQSIGNEPSKIVNSSNGNKYDYSLMIPPSETTKGSVINSESVSSNSTRSYITITILPITHGLPVEEFAIKLVSAFRQLGRSTISLNQRTALSHLGRHAFDKLAKLKQSGYFAELEEVYETVVYIADTPINSSWTSTCIAQGDCVLLLADATMEPDIGEYERLLLKSKTTARTELILLHPDRFVEPGLTHKWLRNRVWVHSHHHIQFVSPSILAEDPSPKDSGAASAALALVEKLKQKERINKLTKKTQENISKLLPDSIKSTVENFSLRYMKQKQRYYTPVHAHKNDFLRLARILSGQAIGLVLGGGGARGLSHLGVLKAIEEHGIPIDMIGGTSIGSFIGGLYAKDYDLVPIYGRVKKFAGRIGSLWRMLTDLTWPVTSYTTGHEFNRGIWKSFGDIRIEDFWIQYYCNSTNITESVQEIHSSGYAWRYIRASMSLAGLLPPITDNGSMLLDGGYVDNLPVWEMKARGCSTVFAVDVGSVDDRTPQRYGDSLNGLWIIFNRWNPFSTQPNVPNMAEIQMRLGYVASVNALEKAKNTPGVIYLRPPIEDYATLDFAKFEEIYQVGAAYGHDFFQNLEESGEMPIIPGSYAAANAKGVPYGSLHRRNSI